jgi:transcriptional regulator with XRE-family HTH domain
LKAAERAFLFRLNFWEERMAGERANAVDAAVGERIRRLRQLRHLSQSRLGEAVGLSFQQIQKYESGKNRMAFSTFVRICEALDCRPSDVMTEVERLHVPAHSGETRNSPARR